MTGQRALVVEGGAMRGIFAAGVLDSFMDNDFRPFDFALGVSAGSTNLAGYLCDQRGRSYKLITDYSCRHDFFNIGKFLRGGHYIDLDWLWNIAYREYRLDAFAYANQSIPLWVVSTNVETGKAEYHCADAENLEHLLLASCAVPLAYRSFPLVNGVGQTDGGVADSIPVKEAYLRGARHITVILSQPRGYRKKPPRVPAFINYALREYPNLAAALINRYRTYNESMEFIDNPPADCQVDIIVPGDDFAVGRTTTDPKKLTFGYELGILQGQAYVSDQNSVPFSEQKTGNIGQEHCAVR